ncbi:VanZ family protein [Haloarchaeobius amylolyticus]|uniref:VanZ family protein n=1 Tax=Haloarchaeobius amylolyticus TaxID=1198296 RepID=UPI0022705167|nr:VanZ family protein [Haloarchaeobius amylolyticus]
MEPRRTPEPRRWLVPLVWAGVVLLASVVDPGGGGAASGGSTASSLLASDKLLHGIGYGILAVLAARAVDSRELAAALLVVLTVALFGFGVEVVQWPLPYRAFSLADAAVNALGAVVGVAAWAGYARVLADPSS